MILVFSVFAMMSAQAQFAKPLKKKTEAKDVFCLGVTGSFAANDMVYSVVSKSVLHPVLGPTFGLVAEWNTMQCVSVGVDVSYAMRGIKKAFATEFLTSYSTTTFARVNYDMSLNGMELRVPVAFFFGGSEWVRPYVYIAPRVSIWTKGQVKWERSYDDASDQPMLIESELTNAMVRPYDISAEAGFGVCGKLKLGRRHLFVKLDLGYGMSVLSNFAQGEVNEEVTFEGWGDIEHERLGQRRLQNVEARLTLLVPLQKPVNDACDFNQNRYQPKR